jgi:hypothetical protein
MNWEGFLAVLHRAILIFGAYWSLITPRSKGLLRVSGEMFLRRRILRVASSGTGSRVVFIESQWTFRRIMCRPLHGWTINQVINPYEGNSMSFTNFGDIQYWGLKGFRLHVPIASSSNELHCICTTAWRTALPICFGLWIRILFRSMYFCMIDWEMCYCLRFSIPPTWRARSPYLYPSGTG